MDPTVKVADKFVVIDRVDNGDTRKEVIISELIEQVLAERDQITDFHKLVLDDAKGVKRNVFDSVIDLTDAGAKFVNAFTLPAGAVAKYAAAYIKTTAVAGGTSVKVALGINDDDVDKYGKSADLVAATKFQALFNGDPIASAETIDVCAVVTDGSALGDTNFSAGAVRVVFIYDTPATITAS